MLTMSLTKPAFAKSWERLRDSACSTSFRRISMKNLSRTLEKFSRGVLLLLVLALAVVEAAAAAADEGLDPNSSQSCPISDPNMDPTYEVRYGQDVVWQIPPNPKSVLFMAHGGGKEPLSFFDPGPKCEQCFGLPEDRKVVLEALSRGYAVITVKSVEHSFVAWPLEASKDLVIVTRVVKEWTREHSLESLPLSAWGHSSGGWFVTSLSLKLQLRAMVLMCSEGQFEVEEIAVPGSFPPTFFAYMPIDVANAVLNVTGKAAKAMAILTARGVPVAETHCWPKPLSPLFFTERIRCMSDEISEKVYGAYQTEGWVGSDGYLIKNPSIEDWESVLWKWNALPFCREVGQLCLVSHVEQELKMAFAEHSFTGDADEQIFSWLDSKNLLPNQGVIPLSAYR